jgi:hypothetical protein
MRLEIPGNGVEIASVYVSPAEGQEDVHAYAEAHAAFVETRRLARLILARAGRGRPASSQLLPEPEAGCAERARLLRRQEVGPGKGLLMSGFLLRVDLAAAPRCPQSARNPGDGPVRPPSQRSRARAATPASPEREGRSAAQA